MGYTDFLDWNLSDEEIGRLHPLKLAFVGDAVFENYIRIYLVLTNKLTTHQLAMESSKYVSAVAQNRVVRALKPLLREEEWEIVLRGRNQNPKTVPKNAKVGEYRYATGFESLLGYLALTGEMNRLEEIVRLAISVAEGEEL